MPLQRLGIVNPEANATTSLASFSAEHLVSVTVANKSTVKTPLTKVSIWVVPANATTEVQYAYICFNLEVALGQSFETFRFAVNAGDSLFVRSSTGTTSFSCNGILQEDSILPQNLAQTFTNKFIRGTNNTIYLDKGTLAERRLNVEEGYTRYNTELKKLEVKTDTDWVVVGTGVGATGPTGAAGPTGPEGPAGGPTGPTGPAGADGAPIPLLELPSDIIPDVDESRDLGASGYSWSSVYTATIEFSDSTTQTTAYTDSYTPSNATDWDVTPTTISGALDEIAARLRSLE